MEIVDTTVISNFALIKRLDVLVNTIEFYTTEEVIEELRVCVEKGIFCLNFDPEMRIINMKDKERLTFFGLTNKFGRGEASCLAIGMHRNARIFTDDFDARKAAQRAEIPVSGTIGILMDAIEKGILTKDEGNELLHQMIKKGFFSPFETLDQLPMHDEYTTG